ncbi:MAG: 4Fe-4S binding protein [Chloroflexota bacterium]
MGPRRTTRPIFVDQQADTDRLVWNQNCSHNLTVYLRQKLNDTEGRIGIVVKPCDSKTINVLGAENRIDRDRLHIIGIECEGILEGNVKQNADSGELQRRCLACDLTEPLDMDYMIGGSIERKNLPDNSTSNKLSRWLEKATADDRLEYWLSEFDRCIRCYACRQACPLCDCPTCLFEREDSIWTGSSATTKDNRSFHLGRAFHLAGRCIGCGECQRACPMDINLGELNRVLAREMEEQFHHRAGYTVELSPITTILGEGR